MLTTIHSETAVREIEARLHQHFADKIPTAARYGAKLEELWHVAATQVRGGKLLRPQLVMFTYIALQTSDPKKPLTHVPTNTALDLATAVELLHYAFLLHDDVIDSDTQRRGTPNLIAVQRDRHPHYTQDPDAALHWGQVSAILLGDLLLAQVYEIFAAAQLPQMTRTRILTLLTQTITDTIFGELMDVALSDRAAPADDETALLATRFKTAFYSFEFPLRLGAHLAGSDLSVSDELARIGQHLGFAFQLSDDLLNLFGDPQKHGKEPLVDLKEGKVTVPIAYARTTNVWPHIAPNFGNRELTPAQADRIREHLCACGAADYSRQLMAEHVDQAHRILDASTLLPHQLRDQLRSIAQHVQEREQ